MRIDIWSDFTCPWCYIGKMNLDKALKEEHIQGEFVYHSFQTVPAGYYPKGASFSIFEVAEKEGMTKGQALQKAELIERMGKEAGIILNMKDVKMTDTTHAHRLLHLAQKHGCQDKFMMLSYRKIFCEGADIGKPEVLRRIAAYAGIPEEETEALLETDEYLEQVRGDRVDMRGKGITGVPYFVFPDRENLYGAQPVEAFRQAVRKIHSGAEVMGAVCSNGVCG